MGGLSSLASMAGINMNMNQNITELSPQVYPQIIQSAPFQLELMNTPFTFSEVDHPVPLLYYYTEITHPGILQTIKKYTIGLPGVIMKALRKSTSSLPVAATSDTIQQLTEEQEAIRNLLIKNLNLSINDKEGVISLDATFHEPLLAAQIVKKTQQLLQQYVTNFKIEKASEQLQFIEERFREKKKEFEKAQAALADFRDRNKNVTSAIAQTEEERLQNEYQLAYEVYSQLAKQLEQARIKVKEDTPVLSVITPVTIPTKKSKPNRSIILAVWIFIGIMIGVGVVFGKHFYSQVREKWNEV